MSACWQCGGPIVRDETNRFGWAHVEPQDYPDHGAEPDARDLPETPDTPRQTQLRPLGTTS